MAHKKGVGSSKNGRESESKRLGVKVFGGQFAKAGNIIVRQRGTRFHPGDGVGIGKDHTIFATVDGTVMFRRRKNNRTYINVHPLSDETVIAADPIEPVAEEPATEEVVASTEEVEEAPEAAAEETAAEDVETASEEAADTETTETEEEGEA